MSQSRQIGQDWPYQSVRRFAELNGITQTAVRSRVHRGQVPIKPKKKSHEKTLINVALIEKQAIEQNY